MIGDVSLQDGQSKHLRRLFARYRSAVFVSAVAKLFKRHGRVGSVVQRAVWNGREEVSALSDRELAAVHILNMRDRNILQAYQRVPNVKLFLSNDRYARVQK